MTKFAIKNLGCKVNNYEATYIKELLIQKGFIKTPFNSSADIYIINSCTVTKTAGQKTIQMLKKAKKQNDNAIIIVVGCYVNYEVKKLKELADIIIGNNHKSEIFDCIFEFKKTKKPIILISKMKNLDYEKMSIKCPNQKRAFVKIQDGCDNYCSYCVIPYVRGNERSREELEIINEIETLIQNGYLEIVLTGINTGAYGKDIGSSFNQLLKQILTIPNLERLRISSLEITEIDEEFLKILKNYSNLVNHLHIPLQSGSDQILKKMNRKYTSKEYFSKIKEIKRIRPKLLLTTDVLVGFPGETDEDFQQTCQFIQEINFFQVHIFPYSALKKTPASQFKLQVSSNEKKVRAKMLKEISESLFLKHLNSYLNQDVSVIFEQKKDNYLIGHSQEFLPVKVLYKKGLLNKIINVKIKKIDGLYCIGQIRNEGYNE